MHSGAAVSARRGGASVWAPGKPLFGPLACLCPCTAGVPSPCRVACLKPRALLPLPPFFNAFILPQIPDPFVTLFLFFKMRVAHPACCSLLGWSLSSSPILYIVSHARTRKVWSHIRHGDSAHALCFPPICMRTLVRALPRRGQTGTTGQPQDLDSHVRTSMAHPKRLHSSHIDVSSSLPLYRKV